MSGLNWLFVHCDTLIKPYLRGISPSGNVIVGSKRPADDIKTSWEKLIDFNIPSSKSTSIDLRAFKRFMVNNEEEGFRNRCTIAFWKHAEIFEQDTTIYRCSWFKNEELNKPGINRIIRKYFESTHTPSEDAVLSDSSIEPNMVTFTKFSGFTLDVRSLIDGLFNDSVELANVLEKGGLFFVFQIKISYQKPESLGFKDIYPFYFINYDKAKGGDDAFSFEKELICLQDMKLKINSYRIMEEEELKSYGMTDPMFTETAILFICETIYTAPPTLGFY